MRLSVAVAVRTLAGRTCEGLRTTRTLRLCGIGPWVQDTRQSRAVIWQADASRETKASAVQRATLGSTKGEAPNTWQCYVQGQRERLGYTHKNRRWRIGWGGDKRWLVQLVLRQGKQLLPAGMHEL